MNDFAILAPIEIEAVTGFKIATRQLAVLRARLFHRPVPLDQRPKPGGALCVVAPGGCCPSADVCIGGKCGGIGCSRAAGGRGQCVRSVGGGWVGGVEHPDKISRQASAASGEAFDGMGVLLVQLGDA